MERGYNVGIVRVYSVPSVGRAIRYCPDVPTRKTEPERKAPATSRGLVREVAYLHADEAEALEKRAAKERASKSEIIRRALREFLGVED